MAEGRPSGVAIRIRRRWSFGECIFDEADWSLIVEGKRTPVESKPLEILRELLLNAGHLVRKEQLMDKIWPDVEVVEASLPTAVGKLRRALNDDRKARPIIETVQRLGYRLAVPVVAEELADDPRAPTSALQLISPAGENAPAAEPSAAVRQKPSTVTKLLTLFGALAIVSLIIAWGISLSQQGSTTTAVRTFTPREVHVALRTADLGKIETMLAAGWDPNAPLDTDRNGALNILLENCEWDPGHDQRKMLVLARILVDGGARYTDRNAWGDTPYSIASAARYCGPDHPVTRMIRRICDGGLTPAGDKCLADYRRDSTGAVVRRD
ncbi:MAG: winged helix-turn-helix domain-containing protein [Sphingomonas bacterium]|nr:winged helix-turn-helix domain-containing protein [Sphingomonas bacterium]